jgi:hypothetical protein
VRALSSRTASYACSSMCFAMRWAKPIAGLFGLDIAKNSEYNGAPSRGSRNGFITAGKVSLSLERTNYSIASTSAKRSMSGSSKSVSWRLFR